jgi:hypothetical protein
MRMGERPNRNSPPVCGLAWLQLWQAWGECNHTEVAVQPPIEVPGSTFKVGEMKQIGRAGVDALGFGQATPNRI